ncbi:hypothetical protein BX600DRAFT_431052 [Xylariales sp. PMI_506]|nr:hypothetical protein BX600DRAFT_431052 [Xylariales sp. PMI_506]
MSSAGPNLAHRNVASMRTSTREGASAGPQTPIRSLPATLLGSPSAGRVEEDAVIIELGCRHVRVGFAGDSAPKRTLAFDPEQERRTGDLRAWRPGYNDNWRARALGRTWNHGYELWQLDVGGQDLVLVGDRIERGLRDAFARYLMLDSKPRRYTLVLPPAIPLPLLSSVLDTLFNSFQALSVSLLSSPVTSSFAAGVRSALVVDIGWHETTVTGVYEYREVSTQRTIRAGKMLLDHTREFLAAAIEGREAQPEEEQVPITNNTISFEECEEVATRMLWCKKAHKQPLQAVSEGLPTLHEQDESETVEPAEDVTPTPIHLRSCQPPRTIHVPFRSLAEPCETAFFGSSYMPASFDDNELPLHLLVYRSLLQLPMDVRAICMSRIIFTGGCSNILGLRGRIFDEIGVLAQERGWDPIQGRGVTAYKNNPRLRRSNGSRQASNGPIPVVATTTTSPLGSPAEAAAGNPAQVTVDEDPVEKMIRNEKDYKPPVQGVLRAIDTLGPWCGASLATQLKLPALATVDRDAWQQQGITGASRPNEIDMQAQQKSSRQSMGPGGLLRGQGGQSSNWTLGAWGPA